MEDILKRHCNVFSLRYNMITGYWLISDLILDTIIFHFDSVWPNPSHSHLHQKERQGYCVLPPCHGRSKFPLRNACTSSLEWDTMLIIFAPASCSWICAWVWSPWQPPLPQLAERWTSEKKCARRKSSACQISRTSKITKFQWLLSTD